MNSSGSRVENNTHTHSVKMQRTFLGKILGGEIFSSDVIKRKGHCQSRESYLVSLHLHFLTSFIWTSVTSSDTLNRVTGITQFLYTFYLPSTKLQLIKPGQAFHHRFLWWIHYIQVINWEWGHYREIPVMTERTRLISCLLPFSAINIKHRK